MKKWVLFAAMILGTAGAWTSAAAETRPDACHRTQDLGWIARFFGDNPRIAASLQDNLRTEKSRVCGLAFPVELPAPARSVPQESWDQVADDVAGFVNVYRLSNEADYRDLARYAADWLVAWNDYLVVHADPSIPYLGWHVENRDGWFNLACAAAHGFRDNMDGRTYTVDGWRADEAWDTAASVRGLLKYSEIDPHLTQSVYFQRAKQIMDRWPFRDHASGDFNPDVYLGHEGPYAAAGMRWYAKSNEPCEIRYVKNTDLVMGEQLFRIYKLTRDPQYLRAATKVLYAQLWDIRSHHNFGYNSFMIYRYRPGTIFADVMVPDNESRTIVHKAPGHSADGFECRPIQYGIDPVTGKVRVSSGASCWQHLGFEAYDLYLVQQLIRDLDPAVFPVAGTQADVATAVSQTMAVYRFSDLGKTASFPWGLAGASPTHITAYNCAQRFSADASFLSECVSALEHSGTGGTIFYSLVPDALFTEGLVPDTLFTRGLR